MFVCLTYSISQSISQVQKFSVFFFVCLFVCLFFWPKYHGNDVFLKFFSLFSTEIVWPQLRVAALLSTLQSSRPYGKNQLSSMYSFLRFCHLNFWYFPYSFKRDQRFCPAAKSAFETIAVVAVVLVVVVVLPCNSAAVMVSSEQKHLR